MRSIPYGSFFLQSVLFVILMFPTAGFAQMFSVGEPEPAQTRIPGFYTDINFGWEIGSFTYTGSSAPEIDQLDFDESLLRMSLESPGLDLNISLGGKLTGMSNHTYVNLSGRLFNQILIHRGEDFLLLLPIQLTTDLTRVRKEDTSFEFQQSSLALGAGVSSAIRLGTNLDLTLAVTPNYGFSFSQGNLFGGNIFQFDGKAKLFFIDLIGSNSVSFGYHFDFRSYNIEGDLNDYDFTSHSITIGYVF